jgi:2,3-diketo-5-methylthio-1-phosphopentane phosphatase
MRSQIVLIRASKIELDAALDSQPIDNTFSEFVRYCESFGAPITVISDGVDYFIKRILRRYNLAHLPVIANHLNINSDDSYSLSCPHTNPACPSASGVCKCSKLSVHDGLRVFVGDGRSDFCAAPEADIVFAKSTLSTYCEQQDIEYIPYQNFADVKLELKNILPSIVRREHSYKIQALA